MKKRRVLSLQEEIRKEAQRIEKDILEHPELEELVVTEEMDEALYAKIRAFEQERAESGTAGKKPDGHEEHHIEIPGNDAVEFSEELVPEMPMDGEYTRGTGLLEKDGTTSLEAENMVTFRRKKKRYMAIILIAVLLLALSVGMTSIGSKSYWKVFWEKVYGKDTMRFVDVEDMDGKATESMDEVTVYREIDKELGITTVRITYRPDGMELMNYIIDKELLQAKMFYEYKKEIIRYTLYINDADSSLAEKKTEKKRGEYTVLVNGMEITVEEFEAPESELYMQLSTFSYEGIHYELKGVMEREEYKKILKNLYFN